MATKWMFTMVCKWCRGVANVGIEKDGQGQTYRVICQDCGISEQAGMSFPCGKVIRAMLDELDELEEEEKEGGLRHGLKGLLGMSKVASPKDDFDGFFAPDS